MKQGGKQGMGINFSLDFRSGIPATVQLFTQVQQAIATGALVPGDQLPTVRQLASDLRVNFNTIARAYRMLDEAGLISTQQGRGTYIIEPWSEERQAGKRSVNLGTQMEQFVAALLKQGYKPEEIIDSLSFTIQATKITESLNDDQTREEE
jgi:GntR family transcriptional regulator